MSTYQLGWNRSYRQALEWIARSGLEPDYRQGNLVAVAQVRVIGDLWGIATNAEILEDLAQLRIDAKEWMDRVEARQ